MEDDFGSRGNVLSLPLLNHDEDRPMDVKDRELADVIIESFDSLTKTFDGFAKNLKPLDRRDVYEATKKAIIDTNAYGGRGGGGNSMVIKEASAPDIPEVREYWKRKTQIEVNKAQRQSDDLIKNTRKKEQDATNNETQEIIKWVTQAQTNSLAFMEDFLVKKALMPLIFKLGGGDDKISNEQKAEEERMKKLDEQYERQEQNQEKIEENTHVLVDIREVLKDNADYVLDRYQTILHEELGLFGKAFGTALVSVLSGGQSYQTSESSNYGLQSVRGGISKESYSDIDAQDDENDIQEYYDDSTLLIESPLETPLGELIANKNAEEEEKEKEKEEEEKEEKKSFLEKFNEMSTALKGVVMLGLIATAVTGIVKMLNGILGGIDSIRNSMTRKGEGDYVATENDLSSSESVVSSANALRQAITDSKWDEAMTMALDSTSSESDAITQITGLTVDGMRRSTGKQKFLQTAYMKYANKALNKLKESNPAEYANVVSALSKGMSDPNSKSYVIDSNGRISEIAVGGIKKGLRNEAFLSEFENALNEGGINTEDLNLDDLNYQTLTDSATYNGLEGTGLLFDTETNQWVQRSLDASDDVIGLWKDKSDELRNASFNTIKGSTVEANMRYFEMPDSVKSTSGVVKPNTSEIINNFENQVTVYQPNAKVEFSIPTAN